MKRSRKTKIRTGRSQGNLKQTGIGSAWFRNSSGQKLTLKKFWTDNTLWVPGLNERKTMQKRYIFNLGPSWVLWVFFKITHNPKLQNTCRCESSWLNVSRHNSRIRSPRTSDNRINVVKEKFEKDLKIWEKKKLTKNQTNW